MQCCVVGDSHQVACQEWSRSIFCRRFFAHADLRAKGVIASGVIAGRTSSRRYPSSQEFGARALGRRTSTVTAAYIGHLQRPSPTAPGILLVANGVSKPNVPDMPGIEMVTGYEDVSVNLDDFEAKTVMILGRGNSAFETANFIFPAANYVHVLGASPPRFAWTRAVNNDILDNYQLKSLDGLLDADFTRQGFIRMKSGKLALTMREDTNKRYNYHKDYDYSYNYNYNKRTQPLGGKSYNYNYNEETERTTDPKKVSRCFSYSYNNRDIPKSYN
ncbi:hypothetical protein HPB47_004401 [Ixodes persulcatus]|uniref:Uncharacterized protein n=1 Tax=Ixodes persulcatus TaxID=34615 RepID=A0AC60PFZ4_IXOPE|nr:hypothetical protein HPB47_004401 [Ixodes persulcatus]